MRTVSRLQGMRDLAQESWRLKQDLQDRLMGLFSSFRYGCLETPILEATELFLRKSGGELALRIYSFTDSGGAQVSLRPELEVTGRELEQALPYAAQKGIKRMVVAHQDGRRTNHAVE